MKKYIVLLFLGFFSGVIVSCKKNGAVIVIPADSTYSGRLPFVLQYNATDYNYFYQFLLHGGVIDSISGPGPFTLFAVKIGDNGFAFESDFNGGSGANKYYLKGLYPLKQMVPGETQVLKTGNNYRMFVTCTFRGADTAFEVNGSIIDNEDQVATNGLLQVMERDVYSYYFPSCMDAVNSNTDWTLFAYAVKRANLTSLLSDTTQQLTVLVPANESLQNAGYTLETIRNSDPDSLAQLVKYHLLPGRHYLCDFYFQYQGDGKANDTVSVMTLNGAPLQVIIKPGYSPQNRFPYNSPSFMGPHNIYPVDISSYGGAYDMPCGQGVVHGLDSYYFLQQ